MSLSVIPMSPAEVHRAARTDPEGGLGTLRTEAGNLPLDSLDVQATITGLVGRVLLTAVFHNPHDTALAATYVFPLPDRAAVTGMTMTADGREVVAELRERGAARQEYDRALAAGQRALITEEDRPDVFTMRVGNILPGEQVTVRLRMVSPLPYEDGAATFRFPLVVAPRYIPGTPLASEPVGDGHAADTDATPDASRISPPVLLPGFPHPVRLSIGVTVDPAGLRLGEVRSSLHTVVHEGDRISIVPGERADRDFVLRLPYAGDEASAVCVPDGPADDGGTYRLTVLPPVDAAAPRPRDVVLLLDRSGSMGGWKMVAARRAAARIVDTLTADDRFAVLTFDDRVEYPADLGRALVEATDRHRFRAVEHLARVDARGGTELLAPLRDGLALLSGSDGEPPRDRVLVLVTDGQVGNEDQIVHAVGGSATRVRLHTVGIDRAVNAGFLGRLAALGAGRCELVESEDRLDEAMEHIHRRIGAPLITDLTVAADGPELTDDTRTPARLPASYPGVPMVVSGRYRGPAAGAFTVRGRTRDDRDWQAVVPVHRRDEPAVTALWARAHLRELEDRYVVGDNALEPRLVETSLRYGVLCRFTAFVAVDTRVVTDGGPPHRVVQPVEPVSGWQLPAPPGPAGPIARAAAGGVTAMSLAAVQSPLRGSGTMFAARAARGPGGRRTPAANPSVAHRSAGTLPADLLRDLLRLEADRLREARERPDHERRELLADLASRLPALLDPGVAGHEPLRRLVQRLRAGGDLEQSWQAALGALDRFLAGPDTPDTDPAGDRPGDDRNQSFWKR